MSSIQDQGRHSSNITQRSGALDLRNTTDGVSACIIPSRMRCASRAFLSLPISSRSFSTATPVFRQSEIHKDKNVQEARGDAKDPRLGRLITDDFASMRESYGKCILS